MKLNTTKIEGLYVIDSDCYKDNRGWFMETYNKEKYEELGLSTVFVQDNLSYSKQKGTIRGLHYQLAPYSQAKLVRCIKGRIVDVAVDIRKGSPTYGKWTATELSEENMRTVYIPQGFAHGFITLTDEVEFMYKCDNFYNKESEKTIRYDDSDINIDWEYLLEGNTPVLSDKDKDAPSFKDAENNFIYKDNC